MKKQILALAAVASLALAACGGDAPAATSDPTGGATTGAGENVTLRWWHNSNNSPGKEYYDKVAADFEADNPGVTIEVTAMQH